MKPHELALASDLLQDAAATLANDSCNDWEFPASWTIQQKQDFVREFHAYNGDPEEYDPNFLQLPNFAAAGFLSAKLAGRVPPLAPAQNIRR